MFPIEAAPKRIVMLRLSNNEDVVCNLLLCKADLPSHGLFKKSKILDPITGREVVVVGHPMKSVTQIDLNSGGLGNFLLVWVPQSAKRTHTIAVENIIGIFPVSEHILNCYEDFLSKAKKRAEEQEQESPPAPKKKGKELDPTDLKFLTPPSSIEH